MAQTNVRRARLAPSHLTYTPTAEIFRDFALKIEGVTRVSAGIIHSNLHAAPIRVKIVDQSGAILLKVRGPKSIQEMRIYASNIQEVKALVARRVRDLGYRLAFSADD